jgi:hypothetical protein
MHQQLINTENGEFLLNDNFIVSDKTIPEDLIAHFGGDKLSLNDMKNGHSNYWIGDLKIGDLYFSLTFYFKQMNEVKQLTRIYFVLSETPYEDSTDSWDNFSKEKEDKKGAFMEKWLNLQLGGSAASFAWGKASLYYDPHNLSYSCGIDYRDVVSGEKLK